jgi:hypothetical protein
VDRVRVWLAVSPLVAGGVLAAHALAYRLTGTPTAPVHSYLDHAPQVAVVAGIVALAAGLAARSSSAAAWPFPVAALATFAVQEHVERLLHTGDVPWLLTSPAFLVGLLLQVPVAVVVWALARLLLRALVVASARRARLPVHLLEVLLPRAQDPGTALVPAHGARGPPRLRRP